MANEIFETLIDADQAKVNAIVSSIKDHLTVNDDSISYVNIDLLMAVLEKLNDVKKETREIFKELEKKRVEEEKQERIEKAKKYIATLNKGDLITFVYGPASFQKQATLPIDKIGPATVQVTYTPDMIVGKSVTAKRNIHYDKIIVPENFQA